MPALAVIYSRNHGAGSVLIRAASWWGRWSHVAIVDGGDVIEARAWHGVVRTPLALHLARASAHERVDIECPDPLAALTFARAAVGAGYDWGGLFGIALHERTEDPGRWFCSELVEAALVAGGRDRFRELPSRITPTASYLVA
jgi:hypothetical protein